MTLLKFVNMFIFQWFCIRLARKVDTKTKRTVGWTILKWVVPTTGWGTDYKYIGARK